MMNDDGIGPTDVPASCLFKARWEPGSAPAPHEHLMGQLPDPSTINRLEPLCGEARAICSCRTRVFRTE